MLLSTLIALGWIAGVAYASHALAWQWVSAAQRSERHLAAALLGACAATLAFELLAAFEAFTVAGGCVAVLVYVSIAAAWSRRSPGAVLDLLGEDATSLTRLLFGEGSRRAQLLGALGVFPALLIAVRALIMPPLGWDTLTYHGVKAALFVQNAGELPLWSPSGWASYRHYPAGAEILGAWAMLPFSSDLFYPFVDVVCWVGIFAALRSLSRQLQMPEALRAPLCLYLLTLPGLFYWVGSGYVEPLLYLYFATACVFLLRFLRGEGTRSSAAFALLAAFAAVQVKITAVAWLPVFGGAILFVGLRERDASGAWGPGLLVGSLLGGAVLAPMLIRNILEQGLPLSPYPLRLGPLVLGEANEVIRWYQQSPLPPDPTRLDLELRTHRQLLGLRADNVWPSLGPLSAFVILLAPLGWRALWRRQRAMAVAAAALVGANLLSYYSPGFELVRLSYSSTNARFVVGAFMWMTLLAMATPALEPRAGLVRLVLGLFAAVSTLLYLVAYPGPEEWRALGPGLLIAAVLLSAWVWLSRWPGARRRGRLLALSSAALFVLAAPAIQQVRDAIRYEVPRESRHAHWISAYHVAFAKLADEPGQQNRVVVTHAPSQRADLASRYFFLGRRFQNRLDTISVRRDGARYLFGDPEGVPAADIDAEAWVARVLEAGVTHVVALCPAWHEREWMEARPERFQPLATTRGGCGLYRVNR